MERFDPQYQINLLTLKCKSLSPGIYKTIALYIQLVRNNLRDAIRIAVYDILVKDNLKPTNQFSIEDLLTKIDSIIMNELSFITIEHLINYF